jgi:hypothetical protein
MKVVDGEQLEVDGMAVPLIILAGRRAGLVNAICDLEGVGARRPGDGRNQQTDGEERGEDGPGKVWRHGSLPYATMCRA